MDARKSDIRSEKYILCSLVIGTAACSLAGKLGLLKEIHIVGPTVFASYRTELAKIATFVRSRK